jgi:hypothetical protein
MEDLIIWQTYHNDLQIEQYHLQESDVIRLFKGNDINIEGKNINYLNKFYSEIVTIYWVWRNNVKSKIVGFCHYRRQFSRILDLEQGSCQVFAINYHLNVMSQYKGAHNYQDFYDIIDILNDKYGKDNKYSKYMLSSNIFIPFCCFLMNWNDFTRLCNFLFAILFSFDMKHQLHMSPELYMEKARRDFRYDNVDYQCRAMSFLAERLISCWLFSEMRVFCLNVA